ncbi:MAG TPA: PIG-L family deacetylase [Paraburkholderia sp.]|jgi:LmbE family N-acetylglucosaminyl deacetylase
MSEMHPRLLILSPHFGDAVFGCGTLLASYPDTAVCTVFAAAPEHDVHPHADAERGFGSAHDALRTRRREDDDALALLDAIPIRLPFSDRQYLDPPSLAKLTAALEEAIYGSTANTLIMPLGLSDTDHELVYDACCELLPRLSHLTWFGYEEAFCHERPGLGERRLVELARRGIAATPAQPDTRHVLDPARQVLAKYDAACIYASRLHGGETRGGEVLAPERYWRLDPLGHAAGARRRDGAHAHAYSRTPM